MRRLLPVDSNARGLERWAWTGGILYVTALLTESVVSLLPATASVIGVVVLAQIPRAVEVLGVTLVVAAVALHRERIA
jgi:drug/metabolite transporter (DMT)-like permease